MEEVILKGFESIGTPILIYYVWYLYHNSQVKQWRERESAENEKWNALLERQGIEQERQFKLLEETLEENKVFSQTVRDLVNEVKNLKEHILRK